MTPAHDASIDALLSHASGLRALARGVLGDEDAAEDVVQETWMAALERGPSGGETLGGWLRGVARHLALKRRRGEGRRVARERSAARVEDSGLGEDTLAQRESLVQLVDAVMALDEVYSQVVLMHYFRQLTPRETAQRLGVPVATVYSRLQRARWQLRERLDAAGGGRERWAPALAAATGTGLPEAALTASAGGASVGWLGGKAMQWTFAGAVGSLAVVALATGWVPLGAGAAEGLGETSLVDDPTGGGIDTEAVAVQGTGADSQGAASGRTAVEALEPVTLPAATARPAGAHSYELVGRVVGTDDLPVHSAQVYLLPLGHPAMEPSWTDADGGFALRWTADAPTMVGNLVVVPPGQAENPVFRKTTFRAGRAQATYGVRYAQRRGQFLFEEPEAGGAGLAPSTRLAVLEFAWPLALDVPEEILEEEEWVFDHNEVEPQLFDGAITDVTEIEVPKPILFAGEITSAAGQPAPAAVVLRSGAGALLGLHHADAEGRFSLELEPGHYTVTAGGGSFGLAQTELRWTEEDRGSEQHWLPVLDRGVEVLGAVTTADGSPADGWLVEFETRSGSDFHSRATVVRDGVFALPNASGVGRLLLSAPGSVYVNHVVEGVHPGPEVRTIALPAASEEVGSLQIEVQRENHGQVFYAEILVRQHVTGRATWLRHDFKRNANAGDFPTGVYHVLVGTANHGYVDLGNVEIPAGEEVFLRTTLPEPAQLVWDPEVVDLHWTLYRRAGGAWTQILSGLSGNAPDLSGHSGLPPGDYSLVLHDDARTAGQRFLTLEAGETLELDLAGELHPMELHLNSDSEDADLSSVWVTVRDAGGHEVYANAVEAPGAVLSLPAGTYEVRAQGPQGETHLREVELPVTEAVELVH